MTISKVITNNNQSLQKATKRVNHDFKQAFSSYNSMLQNVSLMDT